MRVTVIKGILKDRLIVGFWIGEHMQSIALSYTELKDIMSEDDIKIIMDIEFGIFRTWATLRLRGNS